MTHSKNLATFVGVFKTLLCLFRHIRGTESGFNHLAAGFLGGYYVFGPNTPINSQINMYILSRIFFGTVNTLVSHGSLPSTDKAYPLYAGAIWAMVMYYFNYERKNLQGSLATSMQYLYNGKLFLTTQN